MRFGDGLVFDTVLLLDRFYTQQPKQEKPQLAQRRLLAAVCTSLKLGPPLETLYSLKDLVTHLGREAVPFGEVLQAELSMLRALRFQTGTPTAHDLMEQLCQRLRATTPMGWSEDFCWHLASFLLQIVLLDANLFYRFSHIVLAASCLRLALLANDAPRETMTALMQDLALHLQESDTLQQSLDNCSEKVHQMWLRCNGDLRQAPYILHLNRKFAAGSRQGVSQITPMSTYSALYTRSAPKAISTSKVDFSPASRLTPSTASPTTSSSASTESPSNPSSAASASSTSSATRTGFPNHDGYRFGSFASSSTDSALLCGERRRPSRSAMSDIDEAIAIVHQSLVAVRDGHHKEGSQSWVSPLAARLSNVADTSFRVKTVLTRHGWSCGRFRRCPDREQLLRELREARGTSRHVTRSNSTCAATAVSAVRSGAQAFRRRASSWSGSGRAMTRCVSAAAVSPL